MLEYRVYATRIDGHGSLAHCEHAEVRLDTDVKGRTDAFNPAELLLASLAACMLKSIERSAPMLKFDFRVLRCGCTGCVKTARPGYPTSTMRSFSIPMRTTAGSSSFTLMFGDTARSSAAAKLSGRLIRKD